MFLKRLFRKRCRKLRRTGCRPVLEPLEDRLAPAALDLQAFLQSNDIIGAGNFQDNGTRTNQVLLLNADVADSSDAVLILDALTGQEITRYPHAGEGFAGWLDPSDRSFVGDVDGDGLSELIQFNRPAISGLPPSGPAIRVLTNPQMPCRKADAPSLADGGLGTECQESRQERIINYEDRVSGTTYAIVLGSTVDPEDVVMVGHFTQQSHLEALFFNKTSPARDQKAILTLDLATGQFTFHSFHDGNIFGGWIDSTDESFASDTNNDGYDDLVLVNRVPDPEHYRDTNIGFVGMVSICDAHLHAGCEADETNDTDGYRGFYRFFEWGFAREGENTVFPGYDEIGDHATAGFVQGRPVLLLTNAINQDNAAFAVLEPRETSFQLISTVQHATVPEGSFDSDDTVFMADLDADGSHEVVSYSRTGSASALQVFSASSGTVLSQVQNLDGAQGIATVENVRVQVYDDTAEGTTPTSMQITWTVRAGVSDDSADKDAPQTAWVEYGQTPELGQRQSAESLEHDYVALLSNLTNRRTTYYYRIVVESLSGEQISTDVETFETVLRYDYAWQYDPDDGWFDYDSSRPRHIAGEAYDPVRAETIRQKLEGVDRTAYLQDIITRTLTPEQTDQEKVEAIIVFVQNALYHNPLEVNDVVTGVDPVLFALEAHEARCGVANGGVVQALLATAGFETRERSLHEHTVGEVFYDESWHVFDADSVKRGTIIKRADGTIPSVDELLNDPHFIDAFPVYLDVRPETGRTRNTAEEPVTGWLGRWVVEMQGYPSVFYGAPAEYPPSVPEPIAHPNTSRHDVTLRWDGSFDRDGDLDHYLVEIGSSPGGTEFGQFTATATSLVVLLGDGTWYWHVRAIDRHVERNPSTFYVPSAESTFEIGPAHPVADAFQAHDGAYPPVPGATYLVHDSFDDGSLGEFTARENEELAALFNVAYGNGAALRMIDLNGSRTPDSPRGEWTRSLPDLPDDEPFTLSFWLKTSAKEINGDQWVPLVSFRDSDGGEIALLSAGEGRQLLWGYRPDAASDWQIFGAYVPSGEMVHFELTVDPGQQTITGRMAGIETGQITTIFHPQEYALLSNARDEAHYIFDEFSIYTLSPQLPPAPPTV